MRTYRVQVREVWYQSYIVAAESPKEALELVREGDGELDEEDFEYVETMDPDTWNVIDDDGMVAL